VTCHQAQRRLQQAADLANEAQQLLGDDGEAPTDSERLALSRLALVLSENVQLLRLRAGLGTTVRANDAPDFSTRRRDALELTALVIDVARNYRPGTESRSGAALAAHRRGVDHLREALQEFQRAGMEAVAS
jgi:hypothetical protein